jgi:hypothetical protein
MTIQDQEDLMKVLIRQDPDATIGQMIAAIKQREWLEQSNAKIDQIRTLNGQGAIKTYHNARI